MEEIINANQNQVCQEAKNIKSKPFDTEVSQQAHAPNQDKGVSPWVREKTIIPHQYSPQQLDYHRFLAKIRLSPKNKGKFKKFGNPQESDCLQILKADLTCKIKAQKIFNSELFESKSNPNRTNQCKSFFQRRSNLTKAYKRPKSIDISLQLQPNSILKCSPMKNQANSHNNAQIINLANKDRKTIPRIKKKKNSSQQQKKFAQTMNDFRVSIIGAQKKVYQTLQLNISQVYKKNKKLQFQNDIHQAAKTLSIFNRPKFTKPKIEKQIFQFNDTLACLGKNALTIEHKSCRQKIKHQMKAKEEKQQSFIA